MLAYYRCSRCGRSEKPWDDALGLAGEDFTVGARQVVCLAGVTTSFTEASERLLPTLSGLRVSESTAQRVTERTGQKVEEQFQRGEPLGPETAWNWHRDATGRTVAYVGLDHTGVRQQGAGGKKADGRMAAVALVANLKSEFDETTKRAGEVRYFAGFDTLDDVGRRLRREAEAVGVMDADVQIALSDGGNGLEAVMQKFFPNAVCILDFFHAKEHLLELAQALYLQDETARSDWLDVWCHRLKHEGGHAVLAALKAIDPDAMDASARDVLRKQIVYFRNHVHRMDYPAYLADGWRIGSGPVESACKTVVGNRLKGGGMRWSEPGAHAVCRLRALYLSSPDCWRLFWSSQAG